MASISLNFISTNRTALLLGDDSLMIYRVDSQGVSLVETILWDDDNFIPKAAEIMKGRCGGASVVLINDMTDQHFKGGQKMPKVGMMDKANVLERKLQIAFPNYPIRGALPMKSPSAGLSGSFSKSSKKSGSDLSYLFAAVPDSDAIDKTVAAIEQAMVTVVAFGLLPVESSALVEQMTKKVAGKKNKPSRWAIFIGHHQNGSLRQIVTRDGQLAMTRMTPLSADITDPLAWGEGVAQEFSSTLGYLSRFGYSQDEATDIFVIGTKESTEAFKGQVQTQTTGNIYCYTAPEAANLLGLKIGIHKETRFADALHVGFIGRKKKFILPMKAASISGINTPRVAVKYASLLLGVTAIGVAGYSGYLMQSHGAIEDKIQRKKQEFVSANQAYQVEFEKMNGLGYDVKLVQAAFEVYESFGDEELPVLGLVKGIGDALGPNLKLDQLNILPHKEETGGSQRGMSRYAAMPQSQGGKKLEATLSLSFPNTITLEEGVKDMSAFEARLNTQLPNYDVEIVRQVARPEYTQRISGVATATSAVSSKEDYTAEIVIIGPKPAEDENGGLR